LLAKRQACCNAAAGRIAIADIGDPPCSASSSVTRDLRQARSPQELTPGGRALGAQRTTKGEREIYDDKNTTDFDVEPVRREGDRDTGSVRACR
jgi:hypothetical protein